MQLICAQKGIVGLSLEAGLVRCKILHLFTLTQNDIGCGKSISGGKAASVNNCLGQMYVTPA